ncbi:GNAT family N-acetyltransferase [Fontisubflavum oceani]|uniref:GNAT family N-acetyltransferase n=1 Tax=Fontisubflavum oceani TaxID=2978973 RepID=UPI0025B2FD9B|nr:GNAT family N-acetyltransferase [Fontisubflavum oceani]WJY21638.1 GNAT family N-acetyltransferase [Fontisubflavum oceani]
MIVQSDQPASVAEYLGLRDAAGMGGYPEKAARIGLAQGLHGTWFRDAEGQLVAMGRLIGDGGCFAQVTDIAVHPDHQRQGLGTQVMAALMDWAETNLPKGCYMSLIADPGAEHLYAKFGFTERYGMARYLR